MAIQVVCSICGKRAKVSDELKGRRTECAKCGGPIAVPFRLSDLDVTAEDHVKAETATMTPADGRVSSARWNKWSLAAAREFWQGKRQKLFGDRKKGEALSLTVDDEPRTVYRPKPRVRKSSRVVTIGYAMLIPSVVGLLVSLAVLVISTLGLSGQVGVLTDVGDSVVQKVLASETLSRREMSGMSESQRRTVAAAHVAVAGATFGGRSLYAALGWAAGGLIGWLMARGARARRADELDDCPELDAPLAVVDEW